MLLIKKEKSQRDAVALRSAIKQSYEADRKYKPQNFAEMFAAMVLCGSGPIESALGTLFWSRREVDDAWTYNWYTSEIIKFNRMVFSYRMFYDPQKGKVFWQSEFAVFSIGNTNYDLVAFVNQYHQQKTLQKFDKERSYVSDMFSRIFYLYKKPFKRIFKRKGYFTKK